MVLYIVYIKGFASWVVQANSLEEAIQKVAETCSGVDITEMDGYKADVSSNGVLLLD